MSYRVLSFDLATSRAKDPVLQAGTAIATVTVLQLPTGSDVSLSFGGTGDLIPLLNPGLQFRPCGGEGEGAFLTNPTGAGVLKLLVSTGAGLEVLGATNAVAALTRAYGSVRTTGSINGAPVTQCQNPTGSGRIIRVVAALVTGNVDTVKVQEIAPSNLAGAGATIVTGVSSWMDSRRTDVRKGLVKGSNFANVYLGFNLTPGQILLPANLPMFDVLMGKEWYLSENRALEMQWTGNGAGIIGLTTFIWDEL